MESQEPLEEEEMNEPDMAVEGNLAEEPDTEKTEPAHEGSIKKQAPEIETESSEKKTYSEIAAEKSLWYRFWKRFFDIVLCCIAMVPLSIVFAVVSILIVREDGRPVFFVQDRNGLNGKVFRMYKFRSMCKNAPEMHRELLRENELDGPAFKMKDDPRITKIGKFIRRTSIDELPQLINIIKGDMSIVGPRPLPTYETAQCTAYQNQRLLVKPGLTCYWQCSGRSDIDFDEWMELDLKYIKDASLWVDLRMIFMTIRAIFKEDGAY